MKQIVWKCARSNQCQNLKVEKLKHKIEYLILFLLFFFLFLEICDLKPETGNCRASLQRWHFNPQKGACQTFEYGGCDGNGNNFASKEKCESFCGGRGVSSSRKSVDKPDCHLPAEVGPCRAALERYFFNKESGKCEVFVFGGCSGNANNFASIEACEKQCLSP